MNDHASCTSPVNALLCFLVGGVAGAGVALLLAPQSGRVTRERMQRRLDETASSARDLKNQLIRRGEKIRDEAGDLKNQLIRRGEKIRDEAGHRVDAAVAALAGDGGAKLPG